MCRHDALIPFGSLFNLPNLRILCGRGLTLAVLARHCVLRRSQGARGGGHRSSPPRSSGAIAADAEARGHRPPDVVAHEAVKARFDRYRLTDGYNRDINARQFGGSGLGMSGPNARFLVRDVLEPTTPCVRRLLTARRPSRVYSSSVL